MPLKVQQESLNAKLRGHYHITDADKLPESLEFYWTVRRIWRKWLNRRTRGNRMTWERYSHPTAISVIAASDLTTLTKAASRA